MTDPLPGMPPVQTAPIKGIELAYYEVGPRTGIPVIFCHGFPELAFSWRHQLAAFEAAGRWAIAPDQRGYGLTSRPDAVEDYDIEHLTGDIVGLMDHLGVEKAVLCGHDWGGIIVWQAPLLHPDRIAGVIGLNTPFIPRAPVDPIAIMRARLGEEMYIVHFQKPGEADEVLGRDARRTMDFFMRKPPSGSVTAAGGDTPTEVFSAEGQSKGFATERKPGDPSVFALVRMLEAYDPAVDPRGRFLTEAELDVFADTFARTGFTGGINWYRNFTRNWERSEGRREQVDVPSLMVMAEKDAVLPPSAADGMEHWVPNLDRALVKDSGHWTQQEQPEEVNRILLDWLDRHFPRSPASA